jgi:hypothetical protein
VLAGAFALGTRSPFREFALINRSHPYDANPTARSPSPRRLDRHPRRDRRPCDRRLFARGQHGGQLGLERDGLDRSRFGLVVRLDGDGGERLLDGNVECGLERGASEPVVDDGPV